MKSVALILMSLLPVMGWAEGHDHVSAKQGVAVIHAWARASEGPRAQVFFDIQNTRFQPVVMRGATAPGIAAEVRMLGAPIKAGGPVLPVPEMPIAPGTLFTLAPDGLYLELTGLTASLVVGSDFTILVQIDPIGTLEAHVDVEAADADTHSHAGHNH